MITDVIDDAAELDQPIDKAGVAAHYQRELAKIVTVDEISIRRVGGKWCATAMQAVGGVPPEQRHKRARVMEIVGDIWGDSIGEVTFEMLRVIRGERSFGDPT